MEEKFTLRILVVDDHPLFREGLKGVLEQLDSAVLVLESATYAAALTVIGSQPELDLLLLDIHLPDMHGLTALENLRSLQPQLPVVIISASENRVEVMAAMRHGAMGFISKASSTTVLKQALHLVLSGGVYLPPDLMLEKLGTARQPLAAAMPPAGRTEDALAQLGLTERQLQVLELMAHGDSNKHIARKLNVAENTVKVHMTAILKAFNVSSRAQAIAALSNMGVRFPNADL